ncbi:ArgP/LysG family DNA-binding transcriptional regulator [Pseudodesulfovibrio sp. JC047]|uniref:LysR family transcriptional regulator ArgP n=1 Tax=Pseudodesulfovibrio sp. JC047 TaxID=2683199 RepID=UPI0013D2258A|nr:LysR family transcriptional regulator ArgP [Pseudodesulfovibrio sp. JC047]NDV18224.1 ArgP/LysG family DNA-binding transcriptional regulator [Pseudodesulfovibrio sp. JC047]
MLDYKLVEAFALVVRLGGFEKAAQALHLTQGAVSQRVKLLEEQSGCVLLVRSSPPRPTSVGREVLKHYRQVKRLEEDLGTGMGHETAGFTTLPIGINADSLATWFLPALETYLATEPVLLDLSVDDQAETLRLLRDGEVLGCISDRSTPMQGCRVEYLGDMSYQLYCTRAYKEKWFPQGVEPEAVRKAPIVIFSRKDAMHGELLFQALGERPDQYKAFYLPSSEKFGSMIASGKVCGLLPEQQAAEFVERDELIVLLPEQVLTVRLHWHCWNLASRRLLEFTDALVAGARAALDQTP